MGAALEDLLCVVHDTERPRLNPPRHVFERLRLISSLILAESTLVAGPRLLWRTEEGRVVVLAVDRDRVIGRGAESDLCFSSPRVSRRHCIVRPAGGSEAEVEDLGSSNGTFVNGERVQRHMLHDGDTIEVGGLVVVYVA